ncbi:hypothetical protein GTQ34_05605 [Muricauda sp. JGD-17]|uniref:Uncharacterized protein n=1 Tax=Flagellimonas ochracea TaxID=2696472 RepID=A0A964WXA3_9FLAO|nr:DUF6730 family protein [Allomuricauda ochracea]NAY91389.1 hypothetical protein [Allomuricauda ochracea]
MGYKKLDEVMELLTDELDGFNRAIDKLEQLTQNVDNIKIQTDTTQIEFMLREHLMLEKTKNTGHREDVQSIREQVSRARLVPKVQLWFSYAVWMISSVIICYLAFKVSQIDNIQEKAFTTGEQHVITSLRGYFDQNPEHFKSYQKWVKEKDSVPNQK